MGLDPKRRREIKKQEEQEAKERAKAANAANRKYERRIKPMHEGHSVPRGGRPASGPGPHIVNIYGDHVQVHGDGNQVAIGTGGDVHQLHAEQPVDLDVLRGLIRDLQASQSHIDFPGADTADEVRELADEIANEAAAPVPDHGRLRRAATSIGRKLQTVPTTAIGGFIAQGLAAAFLPLG